MADVAVVWAKCEDGKIRGFIVERKETEDRLTTPVIRGKLSLRASTTGMILMDDVVVPVQNMLPNVEGLKASNNFLNVPSNKPSNPTRNCR